MVFVSAEPDLSGKGVPIDVFGGEPLVLTVVVIVGEVVFIVVFHHLPDLRDFAVVDTQS